MNTDKLKFSFLFLLKKSDKWSIPLSIHNELKRRGHECKIYTLFAPNEEDYSEDGLIRMLNEAHNGVYVPDVVFHMNFGLYKSQYLSKEYFPDAKWLFESGDDPQSFQGHNYHKAVHGHFDAIFSPDIRCANIYKEKGFNAHWWTHFADTTLYPEKEIEIKYDAVSTRDPQEEFFQEIKKGLGDKFETRRGFHAMEHADFLRSSKIVVQHSRYKEVTRRVFEGMLAKRLVITDRLGDDTHLNKLFKENSEIVFYDNPSDAIDKIKYYAENEEERNAIALNGYNNVLNNHTQIQRVNKVLEVLGEM